MKKQFINKAKSLIKQIKKSNKAVGSIFLDLGFIVYKPQCYTCCGIIYKHGKEKIIVKPYPCLIGPKPSSYIVPMLSFEKDYEKWCVQPLCDRKNAIKASRFFAKKFPNWYDNDPCNVGYWNGRPCIFDW